MDHETDRAYPEAMTLEEFKKAPAKLQVEVMRHAALEWLRYKRQCRLVMFERSHTPHWRPDVLGINQDRRSIEVEIKRTFSDFKNDKKKWCHGIKAMYVNQFYFMVPEWLIDKVMENLPEGAGLLGIKIVSGISRLPYPDVICPAKKRRDSRVFDETALFDMGRDVTGTLASTQRDLVKALAKVHNQGEIRFQQPDLDPFQPPEPKNSK